MLIKGLKSKIITSKDNLLESLVLSLKGENLKDGDILVITSKVLAVTQGLIAKIKNEKDFHRLVKAEADQIIGQSQVTLTLKNGILIPWAGIDRSNIQKGYAVLWPKKPFDEAWKLRELLMKKYRLKKLGVLISDSRCIPLRKGVVGIALGYAGFKGVNDLRGKKDLYGNKLKVTQQAMADNLATSANLVMGESSEAMPFGLIQDAPVSFTGKKVDPSEPVLKPAECLFLPLYSPFMNDELEKSAKELAKLKCDDLPSEDEWLSIQSEIDDIDGRLTNRPKSSK